MEKSILKITMLTISLGLVFMACEKSSDELYEEQNLEVNDNLSENVIQSDKVRLPSKEVARIQKNGYEYRFISIGDEGDMLVREILYHNIKSNNYTSNLANGEKPLDIFLKITDTKVAIPKSIAQTGSASIIQKSGRKVQNTETLLKITDIDNNILNPNTLCLADAGENSFTINNCGGTITSSADDIRFCDEELIASKTRKSRFAGQLRNADYVYHITNFCGDTKLRFYSWVSNAWQLTYRIEYNGNGLESNVYFGTSNTGRKLVREGLDGGRFRSFTQFVDFPNN